MFKAKWKKKKETVGIVLWDFKKNPLHKIKGNNTTSTVVEDSDKWSWQIPNLSRVDNISSIRGISNW